MNRLTKYPLVPRVRLDRDRYRVDELRVRVHGARGGVFFDRGLLAMGNLMFLSGVTLTIGPKQTMKFFVRPRDQRGAFCFLFGLALVLYGWPFWINSRGIRVRGAV